MTDYNKEFIKFLDDFERPSYQYKWLEISPMRYNYIKNQHSKLKPETFEVFDEKRKEFVKLKIKVNAKGYTLDQLYSKFRYHKNEYFDFIKKNDLPIEITKIFDARWTQN